MSVQNIFKKFNCRDTQLLPKFPKFTLKTKIYFFVFILLSAFITQSVFAQTTNLLKEKQDAMKKGNNQEAWLGGAMDGNMAASIVSLTGEIPFNEDGSVDLQSYTPGGAIGSATQLIASIYNPPISGIEYIASLKNNFLGKSVYAQGVGTKGIAPLIPIWKTFRNFIYTLSSLFFVIVGIMIMLRVKISPQVVISVQNSIPKIITTLILVTFSYAIAGLIIDISYFFQAIFLGLLFQSQPGGLASGKILNYSFSQLSNAGMGAIWSFMWNTTPVATLWAIGALPLAIIGGILGTAVPGVGNLIGFGVGAIVGGLLMPLIIAIVLFVWLVKLFFGLIKCYITILFKIILGPLEIGFGAIPNMKIGFNTWLLDIIANVAVFPLTLLFIVIANLIVEASKSSALWAPSLIDGNIVGEIAKINGGLLPVGIGLASLSIMSKLPTMIPEFIFQIKPSPWGKAIGEGFSGIAKSGITKKITSSAMGGVANRFDENYEKVETLNKNMTRKDPDFTPQSSKNKTGHRIASLFRK